MIKSPRLSKGNTIGIIAPGSPVKKESVNAGAEYLKKLGFEVCFGSHLFFKSGYLAGADEDRLRDIHKMFEAAEIDAIICARGGYGSNRLLERLDYGLIRNNPKIFVGYSDITALQAAILKKSELITFSGPMLSPDFGLQEIDEFALSHFFELLSGSEDAGIFSKICPEKLETLYPGIAEGVLVCGCLSVLAGIAGTEYWPDMKNAILVIEDIGEEPYRLDRALSTLRLHGVFDKINGLILGQFVDCEPSNARDKNINIKEIITPIVTEYKIPSMMNFLYGHIQNKLTLPYGVKARINTENGDFFLTEKAVL